MKKRILAALCAAVGMFTLATPALALDKVNLVDEYPVISYNAQYYIDRHYSTVEEMAARQLFSYGLFQGSGVAEDGTVEFNLTASMSRQEAVTMLVRLLGKEEEAKAGNWTTPFTDVDAWAQPYVGYAYANDLTHGSGDKTFGSAGLVNGDQYLTFILRALGYSDTDGDFTWADPTTLAQQVGLLSPCLTIDSFQRGDAALISYDALSAQLKSSDTTLLEKLEAEGAASRQAVVAMSDLDLYPDSEENLREQVEYARAHMGDTVRLSVQFRGDLTREEMDRTVWNVAQALPYSADVDYYPNNTVPDDQDDYIQKLFELRSQYEYGSFAQFQAESEFVAEHMNCSAYVLYYDYEDEFDELIYGDGQFAQELSQRMICNYAERNLIGANVLPSGWDDSYGRYYRVDDMDRQLAAMQYYYDVSQELFHDGMSDYEKVKAAYQFIAQKVDYDYDTFEATDPKKGSFWLNQDQIKLDSFNWVGFALTDCVVCEGYSQAMKALMNMAEVPCIVVTGEPESWDESGHAWNKVYLDGNWYNLDITWDDNGTTAGTDYFLKSDASFRRDAHGPYLYNSNRTYISRDSTDEYYPAPTDYPA
jgi:hypothetical protein